MHISDPQPKGKFVVKTKVVEQEYSDSYDDEYSEPEPARFSVARSSFEDPYHSRQTDHNMIPTDHGSGSGTGKGSSTVLENSTSHLTLEPMGNTLDVPYSHKPNSHAKNSSRSSHKKHGHEDHPHRKHAHEDHPHKKHAHRGQPQDVHVGKPKYKEPLRGQGDFLDDSSN